MTTSPPADPATAYAQAVVAGEVIAGPHVRAACARHLRDLETGHERGLVWRPDLVARVVGFFHDVLRLTGGEHEGKPFDLEPWEAFIEGSLFGWLKDGARRFRVAFVLTGKGSGKSPLAAGTGNYMATADKEPRAEVYAAATDKEQAGILFRDAVAQVRMSQPLEELATFSGGPGREYNIAFLRTGSFFRPISSEATAGRGKSGYRPHCVLLDEIHEHPSNMMVEFMRAGTKGRRQALIFMITNAGVDRTSVCYEYQQYGEKVASGALEDDSFFSYICACDEGEDPLTDPPDPALGYPRSWAKTNPSIGITFKPKYLEEQVAAAKGMPSKASIVRRLNFCQWVDAEDPWIDGDLWRACEVDSIEEPEDAEWWLALDLSARRDLTALAAARLDEDGDLHARTRYWSPAETLVERARKEKVPYDVWRDAGQLEATPGRSVDYEYVAQSVAEFSSSYHVAGLVFDRWRIEDFLKALDRIGLEAYIWEGPDKPAGVGLRLIAHGQGFTDGAVADHMLWMPRSITDLETAVLSAKLHVERNPVLTYCSASAVLVQDATGNKKWDKRKSSGRIDGIVALSMVVGALTLFGASAPEYDGALTIV